MSQTVAYSETLALVEALLGADLISLEQTRARALINSRAHFAYRESDLWDQFLVTGEERVVNDSDSTRLYVPFVGTTSATADVTSIMAGDIDTCLRAHDANPFAVNSVREYEVFMGKDGVELPGYKVTYGASNVIKYWAGGLGIAAITLQNKTDAIIGGTVKVENVTTASDAANLLCNATFTLTNVAGQVDVAVDDTMAAITHAFSITTSSSDISTATASFPVVYLTYKRRLTETYGDQEGDTTTLPREWHEYCALGTVADMLQSDGFTEKSMAMEAKATAALNRELERVDRNRAHQFVNQRVRTHASNQAR